jgi:uncharacterized protein (TIGR00251 family)
MLRVQQQSDGLIIDVRVQPKSSKDGIAGEHNGALKISVTTPPEGGKANGAVIKLLSKLLRIPKSAIVIISGATSRNKRLKILGVLRTDVENLLR